MINRREKAMRIRRERAMRIRRERAVRIRRESTMRIMEASLPVVITRVIITRVITMRILMNGPVRFAKFMMERLLRVHMFCRLTVNNCRDPVRIR